MSTPAADAMAGVVSAIAPQLKAACFRKRRHGFNRVCSDDLVQVVHFQMGSHLPPGAGEVPPIRVNLYGKFTINLGVYVPALAQQLDHRQKGGWINEYSCHLRMRVGELLHAPADTWWTLDDPRRAGEAAEHALTAYGLPWLDGLTSEDEIIGRFLHDGSQAVGFGPAGPLFIALMYVGRGDLDHGERLLREYLDGDLTVAHRRYLAELLPKHGLAYLVAE